jgi:hypothetical protein
MTFKRPYWKLLFISLGCLVMGFIGWMLGPLDLKGGEMGLRFWIFTAGGILIFFGAIGFVVSLLWFLFSGFDSNRRP